MDRKRETPPDTRRGRFNSPEEPRITSSSIDEKSTSRDEHLALVAGVYVVVVQVRGDHVPPRYRRRTYWNLPSAQRAVDLAHMEGLDASVVLCQLVPAGRGHRG